MRLLITLTLSFLIFNSLYCQLWVDTVPVNSFGVENLIVEVNEPSAEAITADPVLTANHKVYRVFVDMEDNYSLLGFSGLDYTTPQIPFEVSSSAEFYNPANTGQTGANVNVGFWGLLANLEFDSYAADGRVGPDSVGILKSQDPDGNGYTAITTATTPTTAIILGIAHPFLTTSGETGFSDPNGGWGVGNVVGPTTENIAFMGQFTTTGDFNLRVNFTTEDQYGNLRAVKDVRYPEPDPVIVEFTSPVDGSAFLNGTTITMEATASSVFDIDSVVFFVNGSRILKDYSYPYGTDWTPASNGTYELVAMAYDGNRRTDYDTIHVIIAEVAPPTITIYSPTEEQSFYTGDQMVISATAIDSDGQIDSVEFYINGALRSTDKIAEPANLYSYRWIASTGNAQIIAIAYDNDGLIAEDTVNVSVVAPSVPNPVITSPVTGQKVILGDIVTITATVTDNDNDVDSVEFFLNTEKIGVDETEPYSIDWLSEIGNQNIIVKATDSRGLSKISSAVVISVVENTAPVIDILSPIKNSEVTDNISIPIEVKAYDLEGSVDSVEFFINDEKIGVDKIPSADSLFNINWITTAGNITIKTIATDNRGITNTDSVTIVVLDVNLEPYIEINSPNDNAEFKPGVEVSFVANASDSDGEIDSVVFKINTQIIAIDKESPYTATWLSVSGTYTISAIAYDNEGSFADTSIRIIVYDNTGIIAPEANQNSEILIFPNPVTDILTISSGYQTDVMLLELYSLNGTEVYSEIHYAIQAGTEIQIYLSGLSSGVYLLQAKSFEANSSYLILKE